MKKYKQSRISMLLWLLVAPIVIIPIVILRSIAFRISIWSAVSELVYYLGNFKLKWKLNKHWW